MSKTKGVHIGGRDAWVYDNSHDVVVARMAEGAERVGGIDAETIHDWKVWASVRNLAFCHEGGAEPVIMDVLASARSAIERHGDVHGDDLREWHLLDDIAVSDGFLRLDVLPVDALIDVVDAFTDLFAGSMAPDPPGAWWYLGVPGGRRTIPMT